MRAFTFAEDNPLAATWFRLIYQAVALVSPGPRAVPVLNMECVILDALDAISVPTGTPEPNGFQPRTLNGPATLTLTDTQLALVAHYLTIYGYQPYLTRCIRDLIAALKSAPTLEPNV